MVRMLKRDDLLLPPVIVGIVVNRLLEDRFDPGKPGLVIDLDFRREIGAVVEGAYGDFEAAGMPIGQRRAAFRAEAAIDID